MTETLNPATPGADGAGEDWWSRLYDEMHADTPSHRPAVPAQAGHRLPPPGQVIDLDKAPADPAGEEDPEKPDDDADTQYEECEDGDDPSPDDETDDTPRQSAQRRPIREYLAGHRDQEQRFRRLASATCMAGIGYATRLEHLGEQLLRDGAQSPAGAVALLATVATPVPLWRAVRRASAVLPVPAVSAPLVTLGGVYMASTWASALADVGGHYVAPPVLGLVAAGAVLCGAGWWIARRSRHWWRPLRWICRIPLTSAVLSLALYTPSLPAITLPTLHI